MQYVIAPSNLDIQHHGILGQKWGKQNGPPYPLGSGDHSAAEKKLDGERVYQQKKNNKLMNDRIKYINKHYADTPMTRDAMIRDVKKQFADSQKLSKNKPSKKEAGKHIVELNNKRKISIKLSFVIFKYK